METDGHYDWLSVTYPTDTALNAALPSAIANVPYEVKGIAPHGYKTMLVSEIGAIILTDGSKEQGLHSILTGEALAESRILGVTEHEIASNITLHHGKISRLDIAVDIFDTKLTISDLVREYVEGRIKTLARGASGVVSYNTDEQTLYLGTRSSLRFFRAYDKGAQLHSGRKHIRLELEMKKAVAQNLNNQVAVAARARPLINRAIMEYADFFSLSDYQTALQDNVVTIPRLTRKLTNTYAWLMDTVAPLLARYVYEHPNQPIELAFMTSYNLALGILRERDSVQSGETLYKHDTI